MACDEVFEVGELKEGKGIFFELLFLYLGSEQKQQKFVIHIGFFLLQDVHETLDLILTLFCDLLRGCVCNSVIPICWHP